MVTKKINSFPMAFRKELKKCESSKTSGEGEEDVYVPKLRYFNELHFLRNQEIKRSATRNQELPQSSSSNIGMNLQPCSSQQNEEDTEVNTQETLSHEDVDQSLEFEASSMGPDLAPLSSAHASPSSTLSAGSSSKGIAAGSSTKGSASMKSRPGKRKAEDELLTLIHDRLQVPDEEEHDAFAKTVAFKMRKLSNSQCFIAEKLINDVLYEAGLEQLSIQSYVVTRPPQPSVAQYAVDSNQEVYRSYHQI